ncbi:MAG: hypothetical protein GY724_29945 [Actinomycetia bacterium]|nr:hypothetical protein [Actinomycetes bacterium]MCP3993324.1 hypothetical protein [Actinomycetes bacterium]MCP4085929.1 hypothetical protein [Actinomycetes bacterium]
MSSDRAQLSSVSTALEDLTSRITESAERHVGTADEDIASELFEIERSMRAAGRRLSRLVRRMP